MTEMTVSETLNRAADLIQERGWAKGNCAMRVTGPTCIEGALGAAMGATVIDAGETLGFIYKYEAIQHSPAYEALLAHMETRLWSEQPLWSWNDSQTDAAPVVEVLRACAVIEASRERQRNPHV